MYLCFFSSTGLSSTCPLSMPSARLLWPSVQLMTSLTATEMGCQTTWPFMCRLPSCYRDLKISASKHVFVWYFYQFRTTVCSSARFCSCSVHCPWWASSSSHWALVVSNLVLLHLAETSLLRIRLEHSLIFVLR